MITSDRNVFLAAHVTEQVKEALRKEARDKGLSMSLLAYAAVAEMLRKRGYDIREDIP